MNLDIYFITQYQLYIMKYFHRLLNNNKLISVDHLDQKDIDKLKFILICRDKKQQAEMMITWVQGCISKNRQLRCYQAIHKQLSRYKLHHS